MQNFTEPKTEEILMHFKELNYKKIIIIAVSVLIAVLIALGSALLIIEHLRKTASQSDFSGSISDFDSLLAFGTLSDTYSAPDESVEESVYVPPASTIEVTSKPKQTAENTANLKEKVEEVKQTEENTVQVKTTVDTSGLTKSRVKLPVEFLAQNPELPTGCEITSLTTVLNYYGFDVDKVTMANDYLEKAEAPANFWEVFLGDPTQKTGFGCYAQPITNAANKYFKAQNSDYTAKNISGCSFENLLSLVENGSPVVIWGTMDMKKPFTTYKWTVDGKTIQWIAPEHCLVLIGYDIERGVAIVSDPQQGIGTYNLDTVKARFLALYSQCVIIEAPPKSENDSSNVSSLTSSNTSSDLITSSNNTSSNVSSSTTSSSKENSQTSDNSSSINTSSTESNVSSASSKPSESSSSKEDTSSNVNTSSENSSVNSSSDNSTSSDIESSSSQSSTSDSNSSLNSSLTSDNSSKTD